MWRQTPSWPYGPFRRRVMTAPPPLGSLREGGGDRIQGGEDGGECMEGKGAVLLSFSDIFCDRLGVPSVGGGPRSQMRAAGLRAPPTPAWGKREPGDYAGKPPGCAVPTLKMRGGAPKGAGVPADGPPVARAGLKSNAVRQRIDPLAAGFDVLAPNGRRGLVRRVHARGRTVRTRSGHGLNAMA